MQKIQYNEQERKAVYKRCKANYEKTLNILLYNSKTKQSPEVLNVQSQIVELEYNEYNFVECEKIIKEVKKEK